MMLPRQAMFGGVGQDAAQHAAQRVTRQHVISNVIGRHCLSCRVCYRRWSAAGPWCVFGPDSQPLAMVPRVGEEVSTIGGEYSGKKPRKGQVGSNAGREMKWRLLLPGASEPRLTELNPSGL